jgi:hypothetical protein
MTDKKEAAFIVGYLSAIKQIRRELANGGAIGDVLDRLETTARGSARRQGLILMDEQAQAGEFDESPIAGDRAAGKPDDFYDGGERHSDVW